MLKKIFAVVFITVLLTTASGVAYAEDFTPSVTAPPAHEVVQKQDGITIDPKGPKSPQTSDDEYRNLPGLAMAAVVTSAAVVVAMRASKKRRQGR